MSSPTKHLNGLTQTELSRFIPELNRVFSDDGYTVRNTSTRPFMTRLDLVFSSVADKGSIGEGVYNALLRAGIGDPAKHMHHDQSNPMHCLVG